MAFFYWSNDKVNMFPKQWNWWAAGVHQSVWYFCLKPAAFALSRQAVSSVLALFLCVYLWKTSCMLLISNDKAQLSIGIHCLLNGAPHGKSLVIQLLFSSWESALIVWNREGDENCWRAHVFSYGKLLLEKLACLWPLTGHFLLGQLWPEMSAGWCR